MATLRKAFGRIVSIRIEVAQLNTLRKWIPLFLISSLSLFVELAVIRWVSGEVRLFAYFKNLPLLAAFLGLSIGFSLVGKGESYRSTFIPLFAVFILLVIGFNITTAEKAIIYPGGGDEFYWYPASVSYWLGLISFLGIVAIFFLMIMFLFIPLGQLVGEEMARFEPVKAYVVNILASLFGVWAFTLLSFFATPPIVWFGIFVLGFAVYWSQKFHISRVAYSILVVALLAIGFADRQAFWSPYNRLNLSENTIQGKNGEDIQIGYELGVQQVFYQRAINLSDQFVNAANSTDLANIAYSYNLPYHLVNPGSRVLIVGSGMGNDVAAAIRNNMGQIVAVEIDKSIIDYGRKYHPERPYADSRVHAVVDDARSYFNESNEKFDLIVFGLLDSHTLLSSLSSVRLDSYVYTIQSLQQVRSMLKENGVVSLTFASPDAWLTERIGRMLSTVFGADHIYFLDNNMGRTFIAGPISKELILQTRIAPWKPDSSYGTLPLSTDDWPYLYMRARKIPAAYWQSLLLIGIICLALISRSFPEALRPNWHFWLLGAAFLLIEFKSITELALLFGTTWLVNSLAISGVLFMALLANLLVLKIKKINLQFIYILLFISLCVSLFFPLNRLATLDPLLRSITSTALLTLPLLFAGMIFSESLRRFGDTSLPFASNFSGSVAGGMLEYVSIWWGIKSLYIIAIGLYIGSMLANRLQNK